MLSEKQGHFVRRGTYHMPEKMSAVVEWIIPNHVVTADGMMVPWPRKREFNHPSCVQISVHMPLVFGSISQQVLCCLGGGGLRGCKFQILASGGSSGEQWIWAADV